MAENDDTFPEYVEEDDTGTDVVPDPGNPEDTAQFTGEGVDDAETTDDDEDTGPTHAATGLEEEITDPSEDPDAERKNADGQPFIEAVPE